MYDFILVAIKIIIAGYFTIGVLVLIQFFIFRGFAPFLPSRPAVIKKILDNLNFDLDDNFLVYSLGAGRSGFLRGVEKKYKYVKMLGVEESWLYYLIAKFQVFIRRSKIKIVRKDFYHLDINKADIIYCHLNIEKFRELKNKLKLETKSRAIIISIGYAMPGEDADKILEVNNMEKWYSFFAIDKNLFKAVNKKSKAKNKVYFYQF